VQQALAGLLSAFGLILALVGVAKGLIQALGGGSPLSDLPLIIGGLAGVGLGRLCGRSRTVRRLLSDRTAAGARRRLALSLLLTVLAVLAVVWFRGRFESVSDYKRFLGEGSILEYLQVILLLAAAVLAGLISRERRGAGALLHGLIALALTFVAMEELAWGQVLFSWQTPEPIAAINAQGETTLHNLNVFQDFLDLGYALFATALLALSLLPLLRRQLPPPSTIPLLLAAAGVFWLVATRSAHDLVLSREQEWAELALYLAITIHLLRQHLLGPGPGPGPADAPRDRREACP
jgi:hypothetical protein